MSESAHHCPFLNRSDRRCATCFSLKGLSSAYSFCFGQYQGCPVYLELLVERRVRRIRASHLNLSIAGPADAKTHFVEIPLANRYAKPAA